MSALRAMSLNAALPAADPAMEPASVRNGNQAAKSAYQEGLAFENVLVNQLAQEMTVSGGLGGSGDGLGGSTGDAGSSSSAGGFGGSSLGAYSSLLHQTLATSIMSAGGTGLALQIARSLDPALDASSSGVRA